MDFESLSTQDIETLIEKNIYVKKTTLNNNNHDFLPIELESIFSSKWLNPRILLDNNFYELNHEIATEIKHNITPIILKNYEYHYDDLPVIKTQLAKILLKEEKIKFMSEKHKEIAEGIDEKYNDPLENPDYLEYYEVFKETYEIENGEWDNLLTSTILTSLPLVRYHLSEGNYMNYYGDYGYYLLKSLFEQMEEYSDWNILKSWMEYLNFYNVETYFKSQLKELNDENTLPRPKKVKTTNDPLYIVCLIDSLRNVGICFNKLPVNKKNAILNLITAENQLDKTSKLVELEKIIDCDIDAFDQLIENKSDYAKILNYISGKDYHNFRKNIRIFYDTEKITNPSTEKDYVKNNKWRKDQERIKKKTDYALSQLIENNVIQAQFLH